MTWKHSGIAQERQRSAEFAAAARQSIVSLMSLDFHTAQQDLTRILDNSTAEFRTGFQAKFGEFAKTVEQSKVVTKGTVDATAVESMTDDSAVVLVAATTQVTDAAAPQQDPRSWRIIVTMVDDGGQIKIGQVDFLP